jgi:hypothetical protein
MYQGEAAVAVGEEVEVEDHLLPGHQTSLGMEGVEVGAVGAVGDPI